MPLIIDARPLWLAATNTYVVAAERGGPAIVIDAPPDPDGVVSLLRAHDLVPTALLLSHAHIDHLGGAGPLSRRFTINAYLHPEDDWLAADPAVQYRALFGGSPPPGLDLEPPERFTALEDGAALDLAGLEIEVLHTPGHTPGHVCFHLRREGVLFSGDQLFAGAVGRWDLPGGDFATLMDSMRNKVMPLPAETDVLPGHGPATTLARELATNPFLLDLQR